MSAEAQTSPPAPTYPGPVPAPPTVWPGVIGTIAIVFGSLAILQGPAVLIYPLIMKLVKQLPAGSTPSLAFMDKWTPFIYANAALASTLGLLLLLAGISMVKRRRRSRPLVRAWSVLKLLYAFGALPINIMVQLDQLAAWRQDPNISKNPVMTGPFMETMMIVGVAFGAVWVAALPIFMLVWFSRKTVREQVAAWS